MLPTPHPPHELARWLSGVSLLLGLGLGAVAQAQPAAPSAAASGPNAAPAPLTPMERAQREADKVLYWVRLHGSAPARPPAAKEAVPSVGVRAAAAASSGAPSAAPAAAPTAAPTVATTAAALATKRPMPPLRTIAAPAATGAQSAPGVRAASDSNDSPAAAKVDAEPPESTTSAVATAVTDATEPPPKELVPTALPDAVIEKAAPAATAEPEPRDNLDTPPAPAAAEERLQPIAQPSPDFPAAVVQALRRGTVRIQFNVMPDGSVSAAEVITSSSARLIPAALAAVQQWRFRPVARAQAAQVELAFNID